MAPWNKKKDDSRRDGESVEGQPVGQGICPFPSSPLAPGGQDERESEGVESQTTLLPVTVNHADDDGADATHHLEKTYCVPETAPRKHLSCHV